jgi:hypothetical protein
MHNFIMLTEMMASRKFRGFLYVQIVIFWAVDTHVHGQSDDGSGLHTDCQEDGLSDPREMETEPGFLI